MRRLALLLCLLGCGGGNQYGYAPEYEALSEEEPHFEQGVQMSYEEVRRDPLLHKDRLVAWFGVVTGVEKADGGRVKVAMNLRFHQPRHLCSDQFDSSCRVTISQKTGGPFSALLTMRPEDHAGRDRLYTGSLVKIYGHPVTDFDERGGPILDAEYYRHWPRGTFVSTGRSVNMRR